MSVSSPFMSPSPPAINPAVPLKVSDKSAGRCQYLNTRNRNAKVWEVDPSAYRIDRLIGSGSYGCVAHAEDLRVRTFFL